MKVEELTAINNSLKLNDEMETLTARLKEMETQNTELLDKCRQFEDESQHLRSQLDELSPSLGEDNIQICSKDLEDALLARESEIAELQGRIDNLTDKMSRKRRRASHHTSDMHTSSVIAETESESILLGLLEELTKIAAVESLDSAHGQLDNVIACVKDYLSGNVVLEAADMKDVISPSPGEVEKALTSTDALNSTVSRELVEVKQLHRASSVVQAFEAKEADNKDDKWGVIENLEMHDDTEKEKEKSEPLKNEEQMSSTKEELIEFYESRIKSLYEEFYAELMKREEMFTESDKQRDKEFAQKESCLQEMTTEVQRLKALLENIQQNSSVHDDGIDSSNGTVTAAVDIEEEESPEHKRKQSLTAVSLEFGESALKFEEANEEFKACTESRGEENDGVEDEKENVQTTKSEEQLSNKEEELIQYYESQVGNLREEFKAELVKREQLFSESDQRWSEELAQKDSSLQEMCTEVQRLKALLENIQQNSSVHKDNIDSSNDAETAAIDSEERSPEHQQKQSLTAVSLEVGESALKFEKANEEFKTCTESRGEENDGVEDKKENSLTITSEKQLSNKEEELIRYYECQVENLREELLKKEELFSDSDSRWTEELAQKDSSLQEMSAEVQRLRKLLEKEEEKACVYENDPPVCESEEQGSPERKRKHSDDLIVIKESAAGEVPPKRLKDDKACQISKQSDEIAHLKGQLESVHAAKETQEQEFGEKMREKEKELDDLMEKIKLLNENMHHNDDTSKTEEPNEISSADDYAGPQESVHEPEAIKEEETVPEDMQEEQKSSEIDICENLSATGYDIQLEEMAERIKNLQEELHQRNEHLQEKVCEIEHLKLLIGSQSDNDSQDELPPCDVTSQEEATEEVGEITVVGLHRKLAEAREANERMLLQHDINVAQLQRTYQAELAEKRKELQEKSKEIDRLTRKSKCEMLTLVENPIAEALEEELGKARTDLETANHLLNENANRHDEEISVLKKEIDDMLLEKDKLLKEKEGQISEAETSSREEINALQKELEEVLDAKENLVKENEIRIAEAETRLREEIDVLNEKWLAAVSEKENLETVHETRVLEVEEQFRGKLKQTVSEKEDVRKELDELREKADFELSEKDSTIEQLETDMREMVSNKDALLAEHEATIERIKGEMKELDESNEKLLEEYETTKKRLQQDYDEQIDSIRQAVEEKERELVRTQEDNVNSLRLELDRERENADAIVNESSIQIGDLESKILNKEAQLQESLVENERINDKVEKLVSEANQMSKDLNEKNSRISELEYDLARAAESSEKLSAEQKFFVKLTEERDSLQKDLDSTTEELSKVRKELRETANQIVSLETKVAEKDEAMENLKIENESKVGDLQRQNGALSGDLEKLFEENQNLKINSEEYLSQLQELKNERSKVVDASQNNEGNTSSLETQSSEVMCISQVMLSSLSYTYR